MQGINFYSLLILFDFISIEYFQALFAYCSNDDSHDSLNSQRDLNLSYKYIVCIFKKKFFPLFSRSYVFLALQSFSCIHCVHVVQSLSKSKMLGREQCMEYLEKANVMECELLEERWLSDECRDAIISFMQRKNQAAWGLFIFTYFSFSIHNVLLY